MAEADVDTANSDQEGQARPSKVTNRDMFKLYEQYKDINYKLAVEKYIENFAEDQTVQELTVYNRLKGN